MATITPKENYLRLGRGEMPEWVPAWRMGMRTVNSPVWSVFPSVMGSPFMGAPPADEANPRREWTDSWGITRTAVEEVGNAGLPKPGHFILDDVTKWDQVVKWPAYPENFDTVDWEAMAKEDMKDIDREQVGVSAGASFGPFTTLIDYMGFTEGLCALLEEPEAVKEMLNNICDYYMPIMERTVNYYQPDMVSLFDDTASKYAPFFSVEVYKDIFKPIYTRLAQPAIDRGIPIQFHNCGRCEDFIPDMLDFGVKYWDPAQQENDLLRIKEEFKGQFVIVGGFDFVPASDRDTTEEEIREYIRSIFDKYAVGGGYAYAGGIIGSALEAEKVAQYNAWLQDEVASYGANFYKK
ncbi:MAG: veratrol--corrinoid protein metyltransferase [Eubacteriaceae bacterium]|nr:veratrol--corrinoid protein metyltransferase [Eubacteriaceae bacterium]